MTALLHHSARVVRWVPLAAVAVLVGAVAFAARLSGHDVMPAVSALTAGAAAAAVSLALEDPMHELLDAVPTPRWRRTTSRLVWILPAAIATWSLDASLGAGTLAATLADVNLVEFAALTATAIAVYTLVEQARPDAAASSGAAVALGWVLWPVMLPRVELGGLARAWLDHPFVVIALAVAVGATSVWMERGTRLPKHVSIDVRR